ncbi:VirB4 family type IV secretion system protein [Catenulispora pinisilvae]|uniref:VirB4 family type IV secretion system protein n=1 Tax=Catenulispora pinisilvae TaxID=2705253 RepID=UPI00189216F4|nr:ATP-binding protein [Catenulispora pinisilvae]
MLTNLLPRRHQRTASWIGPASLGIGTRTLSIGDDFATSFAAVDYPAEVMPGWLDPLTSYAGRLDLALHVEPVPSNEAADRLRRQRARLESSRRRGFDRAALDDPDLEAAAADARELAYRVSSGAGKLFRVGIYLTVHAASEAELAIEAARVRAIADSMLLKLVPLTYRAVAGWCATLPLGIDTVLMRRTFDTEALATCFPFASTDLPLPREADSAVLLGTNATGGGAMLWDRWALPNFNSVTLASSGAGKSYVTKLEMLRSLYRGVRVLVVDPEDEYDRVAAAVGGTRIALGLEGVRINPFDLPRQSIGAGDALRRRAMFAQTVVAVLLGSTLTADERAALDAAVLAAYHAKGITEDPATQHLPVPTLDDVVNELRDAEPSASRSIAERLTPHTQGSFAGLFNGPTTVETDGHLTVFALRHLPDELRAVGILLTLDVIWREISGPQERRKRLVVVDEAWQLMSLPDGARFLCRMAKSARKYWAGLAVVSQDAADFLGTDFGLAVVANSATQILLRQSSQAIDHVANAFRLSAGERAFALSAARGQGLVLSGSTRAAFASVASATEHDLVTTDPAEIAALSRSANVEELA